MTAETVVTVVTEETVVTVVTEKTLVTEKIVVTENRQLRKSGIACPCLAADGPYVGSQRPMWGDSDQCGEWAHTLHFGQQHITKRTSSVLTNGIALFTTLP